MTNLVRLFNDGFDYARLTESGVFIPCSLKRTATHALHATRWNVMERTGDWRKLYRDYRTRPDGYALSVCATPLRRRVAPRPYTIPLDVLLSAPGYRASASLEAKRTILESLARCAIPRRQRRVLRERIRKADGKTCDRLWLIFHR